MNRRLLVFIPVFLIACAAGLGYTYSIPPTYVATATLLAEPGMGQDPVPDRTVFTANEAQTLNSNEMLERVLVRAREKALVFPSFESAARLREVLAARPVPGTNTIELQARGSDRMQLPQLLDLWAATYLESRDVRRDNDRSANAEDARKAVDSVEARVARRRAELDEFRREHNIVSPEREDNEIAAQMRSLTGAVNDARNKVIDAESRLSAIHASIANGSPVYRAQDKTVISQLEQQIADLRHKLKELELRFTPDYLAIEPGVKTMHANIRQLEQQIVNAQRNSQQAMLNEAKQELVLAQKNMARLEAELGDRRSQALKFTSRFTEHKARMTELAQLESQLSVAKERLARLERTERTREPQYELLGRAAVPDTPAHPDYVRYAAYSIGGALGAALLAVLLVDFLSPRRRVEPPSHPQPIIQIAYPSLPAGTRSESLSLPGSYVQLPASPERLPVPALAEAPRELTHAEVRALRAAATADGRLVIAALFSGLTLEELAQLQWSDVDLDRGILRLRHPPRTHSLVPPLLDELRARTLSPAPSDAVAVTQAGVAFAVSDLAGLLAAAAHDAGLEHAGEADAELLRYTYIAFLLRQGLKLSELETVVGAVPPASFLRYRNLSPRGPGLPLAAVDLVYPAFKAV